MTTTDRAPLDLTEQAITQLRHAVLHYHDMVKLDLADARLLLAEIERLRAEISASRCMTCAVKLGDAAEHPYCAECMPWYYR